MQKSSWPAVNKPICYHCHKQEGKECVLMLYSNWVRNVWYSNKWNTCKGECIFLWEISFWLSAGTLPKGILRMTLLFSPQRVLILYQTAGLIHIFKKILDFCLKHNLAHFSLPYLHHLELKKYILKKYFLKISKKLFLLPSFTFYLSKVLLPYI